MNNQYKEPASYAPLKCQTDFSLLRSCVKIDDLINYAAVRSHSYLAICDLNTVSGFYEFYIKCRRNGIKPIIGASIDICDNIAGRALSHRVTLFCKNYAGLLNLFKILNKQNTLEELKDGRPGFISSKVIFENSAGLFCSFPNISSVVYKLSVHNQTEAANDFLKKYIEAFGPDRLFFELWKDDVVHEDEANLLFLELSKKYSAVIPAAFSNCQYLLPRDRLKAFAAIYAIRNDISFASACSKLGGTGNFHFKSSDEMTGMFSHIPGVLEASKDLAFRCNLEIEPDGFLIPQYPVADGFTQHGYLSFLTRNRLSGLVDINREAYEHRLSIELDIIEKLNFSSYFLIVWDLIGYARKNGVPVGPGRGSACSSLVCYLLDITKIDPVEYQLTFERFLNPGRVKMPDIDIDFASSQRYKIINYAVEKYGKDHVAQIITFNRFKHKALFNSLVKALEVSDSLIKNIAPLFNRVITDNPGISFEDVFKGTILNKFYNSEAKIRDLCEISKPLLNNIRQFSIHAGGIVISPFSLFENLPLSKSNGELNVSAAEMNVLNELGYLKIDLLGINALEKIEKVCSAVVESHGVKIDIDKIPLDDVKTYELISSGETYGIFQLETPLFRKFLPQIKPGSIKELAAAIALIRPGPIQAGVLNEYVRRKNGRAEIKYILENMAPALKETYGLIVFQEQVMRIATDVFNYSYSEADIFREIMSKKAEDKIELERERFLERARSKKIEIKIAVEIFDLISKFAKYCFNKAHSAAYSRVAYYMAYYMANYPLEYIITLLNEDIRNRGMEYGVKINFLKRNRIGVFNIDINLSGLYHSPEERDGVRFMRCGLLSAGMVSVNALDEIINERNQNGPFNGLDDFIVRTTGKAGGKVKFNDLEPLIKAGAFDSIAGGLSRERIIMLVRERLYINRRFYSKNESAGQTSFLKPPVETAGSNISARKFMPLSPAGEKSLFFLDDSRSCILKHIKRPSVIEIFKSLELKKMSQGAVLKSYGIIVDYNPAFARLSVKDPFDVIDEYIIELYAPSEILNKLNVFSKNDIIFFEFKIDKKRAAVDDDISMEGSARKENTILILTDIISYSAASYNFIAVIKAGSSDFSNEDLILIKRLTQRYEGVVPLFIKIGELTIATNKKIDFSEKFIKEVRSIERLSVNMDFYIDFK